MLWKAGRYRGIYVHVRTIMKLKPPLTSGVFSSESNINSFVTDTSNRFIIHICVISGGYFPLGTGRGNKTAGNIFLWDVLFIIIVAIFIFFSPQPWWNRFFVCPQTPFHCSGFSLVYRQGVICVEIRIYPGCTMLYQPAVNFHAVFGIYTSKNTPVAVCLCVCHGYGRIYHKSPSSTRITSPWIWSAQTDPESRSVSANIYFIILYFPVVVVLILHVEKSTCFYLLRHLASRRIFIPVG